MVNSSDNETLSAFQCHEKKAPTDGLNEIRPSGTSLNGSFVDPGGTDAIFDGPKQWQIKYAFEKVEGTGFKCKICGQIKKHVRNHYLKHFPEHHECHLCRRTYTRKDNLNSHLKRDHFQRIKTPPDPPLHHRLNRLKRISNKFQHYRSLGKCFAPDLFPPVVGCPSGLPSGNVLDGRGSSLGSEPATVSAGPMDLSLRPNSVPAQNQFSPIYDILPSFYNYFRT